MSNKPGPGMLETIAAVPGFVAGMCLGVKRTGRCRWRSANYKITSNFVMSFAAGCCSEDSPYAFLAASSALASEPVKPGFLIMSLLDGCMASHFSCSMREPDRVGKALQLDQANNGRGSV